MTRKELCTKLGGGSFLSRGISRCKGPEVGMSLACSWGSKKKPGRAGATRGRGQRRVDEVREEMGPQILQGLEGCGKTFAVWYCLLRESQM